SSRWGRNSTRTCIRRCTKFPIPRCRRAPSCRSCSPATPSANACCVRRWSAWPKAARSRRRSQPMRPRTTIPAAPANSSARLDTVADRTQAREYLVPGGLPHDREHLQIPALPKAHPLDRRDIGARLGILGVGDDFVTLRLADPQRLGARDLDLLDAGRGTEQAAGEGVALVGFRCLPGRDADEHEGLLDRRDLVV